MSALAGRVGIVTGGAAGVGRGITLALAAQGAPVVVASRSPDAGRRVVDEVRSRDRGSPEWYRCDVTSADDVHALLEHVGRTHGRLDYVVHNATADGSANPTALDEVDEPIWRRHVDVALTAAFLLARAAFAQLRSSQGSLTLLTSTAAFVGSAALPLYATVKGGQRGLVMALAREWGPLGIRVNALVPFARTPAFARAENQVQGLREHHLSRTALPWIGDPESDIGPAAAFLISNAARYVTGQCLMVNGGALLR